MSVKNMTNHADREQTDPKFYPFTMAIGAWLRKNARVHTGVRVLKDTGGAPARFVPAENEIDFNVSVATKVDVAKLHGADFPVAYPTEAGAALHEAAHVQFSRFDLAEVHERGARHFDRLMSLEEGRIETQLWPGLSTASRFAMQSMVLDIVLKDLRDNEGLIEKNARNAVRLLALIAARTKIGSIPEGEIHEAIRTAIGAEAYDAFFDVAVRFSNVASDTWSTYEDTLHGLTEEWIALEEKYLPEITEQEPEGPPTKGGNKSDDSEEEAEGGQGESQDGDGDSEEGEGDSKGDSADGDGDSKGDSEGDDGDTGMGDYGSIQEAMEKAMEEVVKEVGKAASEQEAKARENLHHEGRGVTKAKQKMHAERRANNKRVAKNWRNV